MLIDRIARLERQLETTEGRARSAEQSAKDAKSALTDALLAKARHQKSERAPTESAASRAEEKQEPEDVADAAEGAVRALRAEYEQRFHAARDRLAREFQERLIEARAAWNAEGAHCAPEERPGAPYLMPSHDLLKLEVLSGSRGEAHRRISPTTFASRRRSPLLGARTAVFLVLALTAGVGIFMARGAFRVTNTPSGPPPTVTTTASPSETAPVALSAAAAATGPAPLPPADTHIPEQLADRADSATTADTSVAKPPPDTADTVAGAEKPAEAATAIPPSLVEEHRKILERDAALALELDALRKRLDTATRRAQVAEAALRAERKKAAPAESHRAIANDASKQGRITPNAAASDDTPSRKADASAPQAASAVPPVHAVE
jgi:hypothetical protein